MSATLNGFPVVSVRVVTPFRGVWWADVDVDPEQVALLVMTGPAVLVIGTPPGPVATLTGVIDPLASGSFVATARLRVVGGFGGWSKGVTAQHFHQDAGLPSTQVYNQVAAQVLEKVADLVPALWKPDYELDAGPASRVFGDALWWVDPVTGITSVGPVRPPAVPDPSLVILEWDPLRKMATLACDALVAPGTPLVDPRIAESPVIVRDVEQLFDANGSRATAWCSKNAVSPLQAALVTMVREFAGVPGLKLRGYRVVSPGPKPGTWVLQAVDRGQLGQAAPAPDLVPVTAWSGVAGCSAKLPPSLPVVVARIDGDPQQPILALYSLQVLPLELTVDATVAAHLAPTAPAVDVGAKAASVAIAGGAGPSHPVAFADLVLTELGKIAAAIGSLGGSYVPAATVGSAKVTSG